MGIPNNELEQITNQYLDEVEEDVSVELGEFYSDGWTIDNKEMAMKVDYVIHKMEEKIAEDEAIAESQKAPLQAKIDKLEEGKTKIDEWLERSTKSYKNTIESLKNHLILFHMRTIEAEKEENKKREAEGKKPLKISKSIKLTYRDLTSKVKQPSIIKDDNELLNWVESNYSNAINLDSLIQIVEETKNKNEEFITLNKLEELLQNAYSEFVKREKSLAWGEFKKTLTKGYKNVYETNEDGEEVIVDTKLVYYDGDGLEVPVELIEHGVEFGWKLNK
mgnify:CR=1 FL=1|jgi:hypothetical protein